MYCKLFITKRPVTGLKEQLELERRQRQQALQHVEQFNRLNWKRVEETELLRVRGLWGPSEESRVLTKWMLDMTEGQGTGGLAGTGTIFYPEITTEIYNISSR